MMYKSYAKSVFALIFTAVMLLSLAACGNGSTVDAGGSSADERIPAELTFRDADGVIVADNDDIKDVTAQKDGSNYSVLIKFTDAGADKFSEATARLIGQPLSIYLDDEELMSPTVNEAITNGEVTIIGDKVSTKEKSEEIADAIKYGRKPSDAVAVQESSESASPDASGKVTADFQPPYVTALDMTPNYPAEWDNCKYINFDNSNYISGAEDFIAARDSSDCGSFYDQFGNVANTQFRFLDWSSGLEEVAIGGLERPLASNPRIMTADSDITIHIQDSNMDYRTKDKDGNNTLPVSIDINGFMIPLSFYGDTEYAAVEINGYWFFTVGMAKKLLGIIQHIEQLKEPDAYRIIGIPDERMTELKTMLGDPSAVLEDTDIEIRLYGNYDMRNVGMSIYADTNVYDPNQGSKLLSASLIWESPFALGQTYTPNDGNVYFNAIVHAPPSVVFGDMQSTYIESDKSLRYQRQNDDPLWYFLTDEGFQTLKQNLNQYLAGTQ